MPLAWFPHPSIRLWSYHVHVADVHFKVVMFNSTCMQNKSWYSFTFLLTTQGVQHIIYNYVLHNIKLINTNLVCQHVKFLNTNHWKFVISKPPDPVMTWRGRRLLCLNVWDNTSRPPVISLQSAPYQLTMYKLHCRLFKKIKIGIIRIIIFLGDIGPQTKFARMWTTAF